MARQRKPKICYLCGQVIEGKPADPDMAGSRDHVPPKQFYPPEIRNQPGINLHTEWTHKKCNGAYKLDEEYFYHRLYPLVVNANTSMANVVFRDLRRRAKQPQTRVLVSELLRTGTTVTKGGIHLPPGIVRFEIDKYRMQRVALKVARGVLYAETRRYFPLDNAVDIRLCESPDDVPEGYRFIPEGTGPKGAYPAVFSYIHVEWADVHALLMCYWGAFVFCTAFQDPAKNQRDDVDTTQRAS